ncbi:MAG: PKD domain-containing protein [Salinivirgaceae bacterium]|nr:PKD domain-containing protein [Salinivirgaceae bacterium]
MKKLFRLSQIVLLFLAFSNLVSCKDDDPEEENVIASFTFQVDEEDYKTVSFTSASQNYATLSWNFGDESALSSEVNPVHTYASVGAFTVTLTATASGGTSDEYSQVVTITDPNAELTKLVGETSKTWKLLRQVDSGRYPLQCGPWADQTDASIWWAVGRDNDELANRPCMFNDEWTFSRDGSMVFDAKGDYWAEGGIFTPDNDCASTETMVGVNSEDLSAWGGGDFTFELIPGTEPTLTVNGLGAYVGFFKLGNGVEVKVPQESITYDILSLTDGDVDTLVIQGQYQWDASDGGYWRFVLVHYDDPNDEPPLPGHSPNAVFTMATDDMTVTCTNASEYADSYLWDFGDGTTATTADASHTYTTEGVYTVTLSATNAIATTTATKVGFITATLITDDLLKGSAWKVRLEEKSIFVGPAMGSSDWWSVPKNFMDGTTTGTDDWSCIIDDEFTFSTGGVYTYATNGSARNDGYFGGTNGCIDDAAIAASGNGAAFGSGSHTYVLTPATDGNRAIITLTNGGDKAAFIGFYKGYYGGENSNSANAPNGGLTTNTYEVMGYANSGTKEYLFITVDISTGHDGSASWSCILER